MAFLVVWAAEFVVITSVVAVSVVEYVVVELFISSVVVWGSGQSTYTGQSQACALELNKRVPPPRSSDIGGHWKRQGFRLGPHSQNFEQSEN